ncbi:MAG: hypothetical protein AAGE76_12080 [Pseudomonadota bacterium]
MTEARPRRPMARMALRLAVILALLVAANLTLGAFLRDIAYEIAPENAAVWRRAILMTTVAYALLLAVPFVPGVEVGLGLMGVIGPPVVPYVYAATVSGLSLSFMVGRLVPLPVFARALRLIGFAQLAEFSIRLGAMSHADRLHHLTQEMPNAWIPFLVRHRYIALAILLNVPGNVIWGGGGGLALVAGLSRLYSPLGFLAAIAIAVAPVPILFGVFGIDPFGLADYM